MAGFISRGKHGLIIWEDDQVRYSFESQVSGRRQTVSREDLVDMEGALDIATLDTSLDAVVTELNVWLAMP